MWSIFWMGDGFVKYSSPSFARVFYRHYSIDLLTGKRSDIKIDHFLERLESDHGSLEEIRQKRNYVVHLFYELGEILLDHSGPDADDPLAIEIQYKEKKPWSLIENIPSLELKAVGAVSSRDYKAAFDKGYEHLLRGDIYQFNLTFPFSYRWKKNHSAKEICSRLWREKESRSPYAHATYIPKLGKLYLSNSPECLFQGDLKGPQASLWTMPIKGTLPRGEDWRESFKKLKSSKKDQGELNMITDLLRNDLTRIDLQVGRVIKKCAPLVVPKIIHQYSLIETKLRESTSLLKIVKAMFPGGSVTGAPKKNVVKILSSLEKEKRGFYCGSTILIDRDLFAASINIRSGDFCMDDKMMRYHAGGGITLLSKCEEEFLEMHLKKDSFVRNL
ncbi:chorismate-binding protein [Halobacteriovorax marinus]|uniref:chorismate-binding protein n=1 Tax=Halobacteriovorax marinus TaxID=97084 RepID=UPI003A92A69E